MPSNIELENQFRELKDVVLDLTKLIKGGDYLPDDPNIDKKYQDKGQDIVEEETLPDYIKVDTPPAYKQVVRNILGKDFEIEMQKYTDRASYVFTIVVPARYRTSSKKELHAIPVDKRSKTVSEATGVNEAKDWCHLIKKNLLKGLSNEGRPWPQ